MSPYTTPMEATARPTTLVACLWGAGLAAASGGAITEAAMAGTASLGFGAAGFASVEAKSTGADVPADVPPRAGAPFRPPVVGMASCEDKTCDDGPCVEAP